MKRSHKRTITLSALTLLMSGAMIAGATFAWFTTSVTGKVKLHSGDLKVQLHKYDEKAGKYVDISKSEDSVFAYGEDLWWEPGYTSYAALKIVNVGNLAFKYDVVIDCKLEGNDLIDAEKLAEVIEVYYLDDGTEENIPETRGELFENFEYVGTLNELMAMGTKGVANGHLAGMKGDATEGGSDYVIIALHMKEEAGNEYKNLYGEYDITLHASQYTFEEDDFGNDYDGRA